MTPKMVQGRAASGKWQTIRRAVFVNPASPSTAEQHLLSHVLAAGPTALATSTSAAWLWGLCEKPIDIFILIEGTNARLVEGAHVRVCDAIPRVDRVYRKGVPVTSVDRTIIESSRNVGEDQLRRILEEGMRKGLTRLDRIEGRLHDLNPRGRKGTRTLQRLLKELSDGEPPTESELESAFRKLCRRAGLKPSRQVWVGDSSVIGRVDFAFTECKVIVELDGRRWHSMGADIERDRVREARLSAEGWIVLRFTWHQVHRYPATIVAAMRRSIADRSPIQGTLRPNPQRGAGGF